MQMRWFRVVIVAVLMVLPVAAWAHGGHVHNLLGTVEKVEGRNVEVKPLRGENTVIVLNAETVVTRGDETLDASAVKSGERVSVDYVEEEGVKVAQTVKLGTAPAASASR